MSDESGFESAMGNVEPQQNAPQHTMAPAESIPPQQPGEIGGSEQAANWPTTIGVISIVLGSGAFLIGIWGFFTPRFMEMMADQFPQNQGVTVSAGQGGTTTRIVTTWPTIATSPSAMQDWSNWIFIRSALTVVIALILLVAGINLVKRRARAIKLCRIWSVLKMVFAVVGSLVGVAMQQEQFRQMSQQNFPGGGNFYAAIGIFVVAIGILWGCAYPVFLLIWFSRAKVKIEYTRWP